MKRAIGIVGMLIACSPVMAFEQSLAVQYGTPVQEQNIPLYTLDLVYQHSIYSTETQRVQLALEGSLGKLTTDAEGSGDANRLAAGMAGYFHANHWLSLELAGGILYLDQHYFVAESDRKKDFGGPRQFYARLGGSVKLARNWDAGLYLYHMSNGAKLLPAEYDYSLNPSINSYNLQLRYLF